MHLTIKERVELVLMSGADGATNRSVAKKFNRIYLAKKFCFNKNVCYYYLNCFICFGALFMAQNVCYYYLNCFICFGALFMAHPVLLAEIIFFTYIYLASGNGKPYLLVILCPQQDVFFV